jgi:hypothetical protein
VPIDDILVSHLRPPGASVDFYRKLVLHQVIAVDPTYYAAVLDRTPYVAAYPYDLNAPSFWRKAPHRLMVFRRATAHIERITGIYAGHVKGNPSLNSAGPRRRVRRRRTYWG